VSASRIPIQNIYFLLCYAWDHLQELKYADVRTEECDKIWDLLAKVLTRSSQQLVKRGLHRNYILEREQRSRPKGKILVHEDGRRPSAGSLAKVCEFDELSSDVLPNQIIAAVFKILLRHPNLTPENLRGLRDASAAFSMLTPLELRAHHFRRVHLNNNMRHYRFVLNVCELIHRHSLPTQDAGATRFRDFTRDEAEMAKLFEHFVRNFYTKEQSEYRVSAPHVAWDVDRDYSTLGGLDLLPTMKTDICLNSTTDKLIIDCKFYQDAFQWNHDTKKFISAHLYQLLSYLRNQARVPGWERVRGMLLYPTVNGQFDEVVTIQGHEIRVASINLAQDWRNIATSVRTIVHSQNRQRATVADSHTPEGAEARHR
jgi:5-methylcytosine-specific restriction enzyme subunit McrC